MAGVINQISIPDLRVDRLEPSRAPGKAGEASPGGTSSFSDVLSGAVQDAHSLETKATETAGQFVEGKTGLHEVMIAQEKASVSVRYAVTLKNRMLEAYRELMNTQV